MITVIVNIVTLIVCGLVLGRCIRLERSIRQLASSMQPPGLGPYRSPAQVSGVLPNPSGPTADVVEKVRKAQQKLYLQGGLSGEQAMREARRLYGLEK